MLLSSCGTSGPAATGSSGKDPGTSRKEPTGGGQTTDAPPGAPSVRFETVGYYAFDDASEAKCRFYRACGIDTIELLDIGWYFREGEPLDAFRERMKGWIGTAHSFGLRVYVVLLTNLEQWDGEADCGNGSGKTFDPDDSGKMAARLAEIERNVEYWSDADGFSLFAGDPGGVASLRTNKGSIGYYLDMVRKVREIVRQKSPEAEFNANIWSVSQWERYPDSKKDLPELLRIIRSVLPDTPVYHNLGLAYADGCPNWLFAQEYGGDTGKMFDTIISDVRDNIMTDPGISGLVPTGTLIKSLMTSEFRNMIYVSDGVHLGVYGSYAAAVIWYSVLTGASVEALEWMSDGVSVRFRDLVKSLVPRIVSDPYTVIDLGHGGDAEGGEMIAFGAAQSEKENDGGYFARSGQFSAAPNGQDGLDVSMTDGQPGRCIWAFSDSAVSAHPILNYSLWNDGISAIRVAGVWNDGKGDTDLPVDPGSHSIDIEKLLFGRERSGMTYISVYTASAEPVPIAHFCLMKTKAE